MTLLVYRAAGWREAAKGLFERLLHDDRDARFVAAQPPCALRLDARSDEALRPCGDVDLKAAGPGHAFLAAAAGDGRSFESIDGTRLVVGRDRISRSWVAWR